MLATIISGGADVYMADKYMVAHLNYHKYRWALVLYLAVISAFLFTDYIDKVNNGVIALQLVKSHEYVR